VAGGDRAQHGRLPESVHQPALPHRPERVGEPEGARHSSCVGERPGGVAGQQQEADDVHPDRQRAERRHDDRTAGARHAQQRSVTVHACEI
jgi:hypothetical protein